MLSSRRAALVHTLRKLPPFASFFSSLGPEDLFVSEVGRVSTLLPFAISQAGERLSIDDAGAPVHVLSPASGVSHQILPPCSVREATIDERGFKYDRTFMLVSPEEGADGLPKWK